MADDARVALLQLSDDWRRAAAELLDAETRGDAQEGARLLACADDLRHLVERAFPATTVPTPPAGTHTCPRRHGPLKPEGVVFVGGAGPLCALCVAQLLRCCAATSSSDENA